MSGVPLLVEMQGLRVLVVGGGAVAARRAAAMLEAGATLRVVAPRISPELAAHESSGRCVLDRRAYATGDVADADLVIAATDDPSVNATVEIEARAAHRLVGRADDSRSAFQFMALHRSGPLTVAVNAGGVPAAATRIRDAIGRRFGEPYAAALEELAAARRRLIDGGSGDEWRTRSAALLDERFCERVERGEIAGEVASWP